MGSNKFSLWLDFINTLLSPEVGLAHHLIDTGELAKFMQAFIHLLIGNDRQCLVLFKGYAAVSVQNALALLIQLYAQGIIGLDGRDINMVLMDVTAAKIEHVGIAKACATLEKEDIPDSLQVLPVFWRHIFLQFFKLVPGEENHPVMCLLQLRTECLEVVHVMETLGKRPTKEPSEEIELFVNRSVLHFLDFTQVLHKIQKPFLVKIRKGEIKLSIPQLYPSVFTKLLQVVFKGVKFLIGRIGPFILLSHDRYELVK